MANGQYYVDQRFDECGKHFAKKRSSAQAHKSDLEKEELKLNEKDNKILELLREEVKPAIGCTGPVVFAYVAAEALDAIGGTPKKIKIRADKDKCSKEDDVGTPGTDIPGVKMAAALGAFAGDAKAKMEVLHNVNPQLERKAAAFYEAGNVELQVDWDVPTIGIYIDVTVETENGVGRAVVIKNHTNLVHKSANGKTLIDVPYDRVKTIVDEQNDFVSTCVIRDLYQFATTAPIEELLFLRDAIEMNKALAQVSLDGKIEPSFALALLRREKLSVVDRARALTSAGSEARMAGYPLPAMACATSGNVGITASLPIISLAEQYHKSEEELLRALALSFLLTIRGKNLIGRQAAMCACMVTASIAVAGAAAYLLGGDLAAVERAIQNTAPNVFSIVCDGPRMACAMKLSTGAGIAIESALFALDGVVTHSNEGVVGADADETMRFIGTYARTGMLESDMYLCKLIAQKQEQNRKVQ